MNFFALAFHLSCFSLISSTALGSTSLNTTDCQILTDDFCLPANYNLYQRPKWNETLKVQVKFWVEQITKVDDHQFTLSMLMYVSFYWEEPRILYTGRKPKNTPEDKALTWGWNDKLWMPDIFILHLAQVKQPRILAEFGSKISNNQQHILIIKL